MRLRTIVLFVALFALACGGSKSKSDAAAISDATELGDQSTADQSTADQNPSPDTLDDSQLVIDLALDGAIAEDQPTPTDNSVEDASTDSQIDSSGLDATQDTSTPSDAGDDLVDGGTADVEEDQGPATPTGTVAPPSKATIYAHTPIVVTFDQQMSNGTEQFGGTIIATADAGEVKVSWSVVDGKDTLTIAPKSSWVVGDEMTLTISVSAPDFPLATFTVTLTYKVIPSLENGETCSADNQCLNSICCGGVDRCGGDSGGNCCSDSPDCADTQWCDNSYLETFTCQSDRKTGEGCTRDEQCEGAKCQKGQCSECGNCPPCTDGKVVTCCSGYKCACTTPPACPNPPICPQPKCALILCTVNQYRCGTGCCPEGTSFCLAGQCADLRAYGEPCLYRDDACASTICEKAKNSCACSGNYDAQDATNKANCPVQSPTCHNGTCE